MPLKLPEKTDDAPTSAVLTSATDEGHMEK
jgi:hypothetical protein